jgi:hypothetical protein
MVVVRETLMNDKIRDELQADVDAYRKKAAYYVTLRLHEAAALARKLANNVELALTTLPRDDDPKIS